MSETDRMASNNSSENLEIFNSSNFKKYLLLCSIIEIIEFIIFEILVGVRQVENLFFKGIGMIVCILIIAFLKIYKIYSIRNIIYYTFLLALEVCIKEKNVMELLKQVVEKIIINKN